jgi:hypothetical protein
MKGDHGVPGEKPLAASIMPAAVQRNAIAAFRQRFTLRQTRRTVPIMFSIELVQASERLSFIGKPRRLTVSILWLVYPVRQAANLLDRSRA